MDQQQLIEHWFMEYSDDIFNYLIYFTGRRDVEDLVQDVFFKALKSMHQYQGRSHPKTWLISIARNIAIDHQRKQRRRGTLPEHRLDSLVSMEKGPDEITEWNEQKRQLYHQVKQLKQNYQDVLLLRAIQGYSVTETASVLGWSESKVRVNLHRALKALEKRLMRMAEEGVGLYE